MPSRWVRTALFALATLHALTALYPFRLELPHVVENQAQWSPDGTLEFTGPGRVDVSLPEGWLPQVNQGAPWSLDLVIRTDSVDQYGPARIMSISQDPENANLSIQQEGRDLEVRLRRQGSEARGTPSYVVPDALSTTTWRRIHLTYVPGHLRLTVDDDVAVDTAVSVPLLWDATYSLTLGNEPVGHRDWQGTIKRASMSVGAERQDLLEPDVTSLPDTFVEFPLRWREPSRLTLQDLAALILHGLTFAAIGALAVATASWSRRSAVLASAAFAISVQLAKYVVAGRHPSATDALLQVAAAAGGATLATRWSAAGGRSGHVGAARRVPGA